ncbi:MAG: hypothetical protein JWQ49_120 [Edaphobacter sp.]|nr:hypothetical protein [Edaphobacter sp.]
MPSLKQMFDTCNAKSYYSRPEGEIYSALSEAGFFVYANILKELSDFFVKFDTATLVLTPGVQQYVLPPDCTQIVSIAERLPTSKRWRLMSPESITDAMTDAQDNCGWSAYEDYDRSRFSFAGPFLEAADTIDAPTGFSQAGFSVGGYRGKAAQTQSIMISPAPTENHLVELAYTAKWIPIVNAESFLMLPDELTYAMQSFAIAELLRTNGDSTSVDYDTKGERHMTAGLSWARSRQTVANPKIDLYL